MNDTNVLQVIQSELKFSLSSKKVKQTSWQSDSHDRFSNMNQVETESSTTAHFTFCQECAIGMNDATNKSVSQ